MISLSKVSYESENRFVSSPGTVSIICYLTKYISVSQKWSLNNHNHHLPRRSDFDWCLVINFTPVRWTTGRNVRKLSMRCDSFVILHMSPKDSLHNMSGESEEKRRGSNMQMSPRQTLPIVQREQSQFGNTIWHKCSFNEFPCFWFLVMSLAGAVNETAELCHQIFSQVPRHVLEREEDA